MSSKRRGSPVGRGVLVSATSTRSSSVLIPTVLELDGKQHPLLALIDSGADENFLDYSLAAQLNLPVLSLDSPLVANALNGKKLTDITHVSSPVSLLVSGNHRERIQLHIIESPHSPVVARPSLAEEAQPPH